MTHSTSKASLCAVLAIFFSAHASASCVFDEYEITRLLLVSGMADVNQCQKEITKPQMINALRVVDAYWARGTTNQERYAMLSKQYKDTIGRVYNIKKPEQYSIPLSEAERVWQGYKVNYVNVFLPDSIEISLQVRWEQEGYRGTMTYILALVLEEGQWSIANVHF
ncbi:MAG: hypothetical protein HY028_02200 [Gammaproteobacteria bacterium]|nr:hypothetical protein [Gammaproteobacteria bacterium]